MNYSSFVEAVGRLNSLNSLAHSIVNVGEEVWQPECLDQ
jgi:hypothetical protein